MSIDRLASVGVVYAHTPGQDESLGRYSNGVWISPRHLLTVAHGLHIDGTLEEGRHSKVGLCTIGQEALWPLTFVAEDLVLDLALLESSTPEGTPLILAGDAKQDDAVSLQGYRNCHFGPDRLFTAESTIRVGNIYSINHERSDDDDQAYITFSVDIESEDGLSGSPLITGSGMLCGSLRGVLATYLDRPVGPDNPRSSNSYWASIWDIRQFLGNHLNISVLDL